ncbi:hypothetical protein GF356_07900 [candidate division GN15 bacterium]|nr:hypothetical protein [candidate division GN15 bacterium]
MKNLEERLATIRSVVTSLRREELTEVDFDALCETLESLTTVLKQMQQYEDEVAVLRQDLSSRIAGMARACAVARGGRGDLETTEQLTERLPHMSARELVQSYGRVAARFRDTFPASMSAVSGFGTNDKQM